jgi:excisionase family DNA binding protein
MKSIRHTAASDFLTVGEVANYLHVHRSTIFRLLKRKELPAFKVGSDWRFDAKAIDRWCLERQIRTPRHRN